MKDTVAHLITAAAYTVIGVPLIIIALKVWWTHPINRAIHYSSYITPNGMKILLSNWPFVFLFGVFILVCAVDHAANWMFANGYGGTWLMIYDLHMIAAMETGVSVLTAILVIWVGLKLCLAR